MAEEGTWCGGDVILLSVELLAANIMPYIWSVIMPITPLSWITSSHPQEELTIKAALQLPDRKLGVLRSAVKLWQCIFCHLNFFLRSDHWLWLSVYINTVSNNLLHCTSDDNSWTVSLLLCSWTCSSSCGVIAVSTVPLQTVQYLYSKCSVLLCSWTCSSRFGVITVSTVPLQTVQFVH
jgi:hypothetical protein